jgi:hypothetical protein
VLLADMNSLNALGNRQIASLQADLTKMEAGEGGPSIQGGSWAMRCIRELSRMPIVGRTANTRAALAAWNVPSPQRILHLLLLPFESTACHWVPPPTVPADRMSSPLIPRRPDHHHPRRPVTVDRRLRFHGSQGDGHGGEGEGQHVGRIDLSLIGNADISCSSSLFALLSLISSSRWLALCPLHNIRRYRRVAKLKTEHKELKARFERAKSEGQLRVSHCL